MPLPHVELAGVDPYRVVHDAVEDGVGDGVAAETAVPFLGADIIEGSRPYGRLPSVHTRTIVCDVISKRLRTSTLRTG